jgi:hypothetical protein
MRVVRTALIALAAGAVSVAAIAGSASALDPRRAVVLRTLDKITGNARDVTADVGDTVRFGPLKVTVRACFEAPPEDTPESAAFLEITTSAPPSRGLSGVSDAARQQQGDTQVFSGWMFASSPGLSALEYPTYDVWVISCSGG